MHVIVDMYMCAMVAVYLITGGAAWLQSLCMVPATVDLPVLVEVDEVHQELVAYAAHKAGWVPAHAMTCP